MGKYAYLNLTQKMIKIRKMVPKLLRKRYSEEVPYDFVRLDDVYEYLTPALNKYGVDFEVLGEVSTQLDDSGNPAYLTPFGNMWRYEADLKLCWTNADHPEEKNYSDIHVVGTNEVPDKAKGAAWSYGLKYYLLNKFNIVQATTEDPDMRGPAPDGDKTKKEKSRLLYITRSLFAKFVYCPSHTSSTLPVAPFLCLATITSARFFFSESGL